VVLTLALLFPNLALAEILTGTFQGKGTGREVTFQHEGEAQTNWAGSLRFRIDDGPSVLVFCIEIDVRVRSGDRYRSDGPVLALPNGCQIRYLLDKYPASSARNADEAAARQMAIWAFSDGVDPATIEDATIRDRTIALVNEARQGECPSRRTEAPDLTLEPTSASPSVGQTVAYTVRAGPADTGQTVAVSVTGPAVLSDSGGTSIGQQQDITLDAQGAANFWVTGSGPGETTVRVELPYRLEAGTVFSHLDSDAPSQRLVLAESRSLTASVAGELIWSEQGAQPSPTAPAEAPQPSPTAPAEAPQPSPTAPAATPEAEAPTATPAPPPPTRQPSREDDDDDDNQDDTPVPTEQPTETVASGEQATAVPTPASPDTTAAPTAPPEAAGPPTPADQSAPAAAGGAAQPRPRSLPNTAAPGTGAGRLIGVSLVLLALGGWLLRRRTNL
jgi:hypothetical protein